jgi:vacuolar-type H+-ATPase subunit I/STV1
LKPNWIATYSISLPNYPNLPNFSLYSGKNRISTAEFWQGTRHITSIIEIAPTSEGEGYFDRWTVISSAIEVQNSFYYEVNMTQAREPDDIDRVNRELRGVSRRLDRLEYTQISPQEFSSVLDRIYEEIAESRAEMRAEILALNSKIDNLGTELNGKIDIIIRRLSGEGNLGE